MFEHLISDEDDLREVIPDPGATGRLKEIGYLDDHCIAFIARSPMFVLATSGTPSGCGRGGTERGARPRRLRGQQLFEPARLICL